MRAKTQLEHCPVSNATVSVVIPHFNSSKTLQRALDSVERQSHGVKEILIVDDGSSPMELVAIERMIESSPFSRLIKQSSNYGPASARNIGWNEATGDWVAFLDSDDAWHPKKIEMQINLVQLDHRSPVLIGTRTIKLEDVEGFPVIPPNIDIPVVSITQKQLLKNNLLSTPTVLIQSSLKFRFTEGRKYSEDYELWLKVASNDSAICLVDLPLVGLFKPKYGESGLSSNMLKMAFGELKTFFLVYKSNGISVSELLFALAWSSLKSVRRLVNVGMRRSIKKMQGNVALEAKQQ